MRLGKFHRVDYLINTLIQMQTIGLVFFHEWIQAIEQQQHRHSHSKNAERNFSNPEIELWAVRAYGGGGVASSFDSILTPQNLHLSAISWIFFVWNAIKKNPDSMK